MLQRADASATFFPNGIRVRGFADAARRTVADGHAIGSHGWDHRRLVGLAPDEIVWRLRADRAVWSAVAGVDPSPLFRPPYGEIDDTVRRAAASVGFFEVVLWTIDPEDWNAPPADVIVERVLTAARAGAIVDLHTTRPTAEALPAILDGLERLELRPVPIPVLLAERRSHDRWEAGGS